MNLQNILVIFFIVSILIVSGCTSDENPSKETENNDDDIIDDDINDEKPDDNLTDVDNDVSDDDTINDDISDEISEIKYKPIPDLQISGDRISGFEDIDFVFNMDNFITFSTSNSYDPDGEIIEFFLDIGIDNLVIKNEPIKVSHLYQFPGKYNITLTVKDNDNQKNSTHISILAVDEWGMWAEQIITADKYKKMEIEIDLFGNVRSKEGSLDLLKKRINQYCSKPQGITITITKEENNDLQTVTNEDLWRTMLEYRDKYSDQDTLGLYIMYFNGDYSLGSALGLTFESTSFAVFKGASFDLTSNEKITKEEIEDTILIHEFFHLTGLVNKGYQSNYPHETKKILHKHHCMNEDCVMYYQLETYDVSNYLQETIPNDICYFCQEDMNRFE